MISGATKTATDEASLREALKPILGKLQKIAGVNYGCVVNTSVIEGWELDQAPYDRLRKTHRPIHIKDERRLIFPLIHSDKIVAALEVREVHGLSQERLDRLSDVIELVVKSSLEDAIRLQQIQFLEKQLTLFCAYGEDESNVLRLDRQMERRNKRSDVPAVPEKIKFTLAIPCLIESVRPEDIFKMAFELHDNTNRLAFLSYEDLDEATRLKPENLRNLGPVSLFANEVALLSEIEQQAIVSYLLTPRTVNCPNFICGTISSYGELLASRAVNSEFLKRISTAYLRMTQPFSKYSEQGVIDFFYDSVAYNNVKSDGVTDDVADDVTDDVKTDGPNTN